MFKNKKIDKKINEKIKNLTKNKKQLKAIIKNSGIPKNSPAMKPYLLQLENTEVKLEDEYLKKEKKLNPKRKKVVNKSLKKKDGFKDLAPIVSDFLGGKKIRKHKGINQQTGKLKRGYKYSGKKLKNGLSQIVKV